MQISCKLSLLQDHQRYICHDFHLTLLNGDADMVPSLGDIPSFKLLETELS